MKAWSVELDAAHNWTNTEYPEEALTKILTRLRRWGAAGSYDAQTISVRFDVKAGSVVDAIHRAFALFMRAGVPWTMEDGVSIVRVEAETVEALDRRLRKSNVPDLVGITEVGQILGVTRQRASELSRTAEFPKPLATLAAGPVWERPAIARFIERWPRRRTGRPRKEPVGVR